MMNKNIFFAFFVTLALLVAGCKEESSKAAPRKAPAAVEQKSEAPQQTEQIADSSVDDWGRGIWNGPEGTWMRVLKSRDEKYTVIIKNLDGVQRYEGVAVDGGVEFERDSKTLTIKPGNGKDTGMKDLAEKQDCLVVDDNEGYCRD